MSKTISMLFISVFMAAVVQGESGQSVFDLIELSDCANQTTIELYPDMPFGRQVCQGIPFDISKMMASARSGEWGLPIVIGLSDVAELYFLHCLRAQFGSGPAGAYVVHYHDGSEERIPLVVGENVHYPGSRTKAPGGPGGFHFLRWTNPHPDRIIEYIEACPSQDGKVFYLQVLAITARSRGKSFRRVSAQEFRERIERRQIQEEEAGKILEWDSAALKRPFVLIGEEDLALIKQRVKKEPYKTAYEEARSRAGLAFERMLFGALVCAVEGSKAASGNASSWYQISWNKGAAGRWSADGETAHSGKASARMDSDDEEFSGGWHTGTDYAPRVKQGASYRFSAWVKIENVKGKGASLQALDYSGKGERLDPPVCSEFISGAQDWKKLSVQFKAKGERVRLLCCLNGRGTVWFDDLELIEIGPSPEQSHNLVLNAGFEEIPTYAYLTKQALTANLDRTFHRWLKRDYKLGAWYTGRMLQACCEAYDIVASLGALTREEDRQVRRRIAWLAYKLMDRGYFDYKTNWSNWNTSRYIGVGMFSICFPEHPMSREWFAHSLAQFDREAEKSILPDGALHESPRYHGHVVQELVRFAYAVKRNKGINLFKNERLKASLDWLVNVQTPPVASYARWLRSGGTASIGVTGQFNMHDSGRIALIPGVGDSDWNHVWEASLGWAIPAYREIDPRFAKRLAWAWLRAGKPLINSLAPGDPIAGFAFSDVDAESEPQKLSSFASDNGYAILRSDQDSDYFLLSGCPVSWAHRHNDRGSFSIFASGEALAVDPGDAGYDFSLKYWYSQPHAHNTITFEGASDLVQSPREPFIGAHEFSERADYVRADIVTPGRTVAGFGYWYRHVLYLKPDVYLIWDEIESKLSSKWHLHALGSLKRDGQWLLFENRTGTKFQCIFVLPDRPAIEEAQDEPRWTSGTEAWTGKQKWVTATGKPGEDYLVILYTNPLNKLKLEVGSANDYLIRTPGAAWLVSVNPGKEAGPGNVSWKVK